MKTNNQETNHYAKLLMFFIPKRFYFLGLMLIFFSFSYAQNDYEYDLIVDGIYYQYDMNTMEAVVVHPPIDVYYTGAITIPATITRGRYTFEVTKVKYNALLDQKMTSLTFLTDGDKGVKTIEQYALAYCYNLTNVVLPSTLTDLGVGAFKDCEKLASINIPENLKVLKKLTFAGCKELHSIDLPEPMDPCGIGESCFRGSGLTSITIPKGISLTDEYAFSECKQLTNVTLPDDFIAIQNSMFDSCNNLTTINFPPSLLYIMYDSFYGCPFTTFSVPPTVKYFMWSAISKCPYIKDLTFEDSQENLYLGDYFWDDYGELETVENLYWGRNMEEEPDDNQIFYGLKHLTIGQYVTSLPYTFSDEIETIKCNFTNTNIVSEKFTQKTKANTTLIVPKGTYDLFCNANGWKDFFFIEEEGESGINPNYHTAYNNDTYYTLEGIRIDGKPTKKGIYIVGNKKVILK